MQLQLAIIHTRSTVQVTQIKSNQHEAGKLSNCCSALSCWTLVFYSEVKLYQHTDAMGAHVNASAN